jgi:hypothetical protein
VRALNAQLAYPEFPEASSHVRPKSYTENASEQTPPLTTRTHFLPQPGVHEQDNQGENTGYALLGRMSGKMWIFH